MAIKVNMMAKTSNMAKMNGIEAAVFLRLKFGSALLRS